MPRGDEPIMDYRSKYLKASAKGGKMKVLNGILLSLSLVLPSFVFAQEDHFVPVGLWGIEPFYISSSSWNLAAESTHLVNTNANFLVAMTGKRQTFWLDTVCTAGIKLVEQSCNTCPSGYGWYWYGGIRDLVNRYVAYERSDDSLKMWRSLADLCIDTLHLYDGAQAFAGYWVGNEDPAMNFSDYFPAVKYMCNRVKNIWHSTKLTYSYGWPGWFNKFHEFKTAFDSSVPEYLDAMSCGW